MERVGGPASTITQDLEEAQKEIADLKAIRAAEADATWAALGQFENSLMPLGVSPVRSVGSVRSVIEALPALQSTAQKLQQLDGTIQDLLQSEGAQLMHTVVEHVLTCIRSWDPSASLESVIRGPAPSGEEAARASVQDVVKVVTSRFERCRDEE